MTKNSKWFIAMMASLMFAICAFVLFLGINEKIRELDERENFLKENIEKTIKEK